MSVSSVHWIKSFLQRISSKLFEIRVSYCYDSTQHAWMVVSKRSTTWQKEIRVPQKQELFGVVVRHGVVTVSAPCATSSSLNYSATQPIRSPLHFNRCRMPKTIVKWWNSSEPRSHLFDKRIRKKSSLVPVRAIWQLAIARLLIPPHWLPWSPGQHMVPQTRNSDSLCAIINCGNEARWTSFFYASILMRFLTSGRSMRRHLELESW